MSFYSELFTGTTLAFSQEQQRILTSLLLEGYQWIIWRGYWDVNALNRQLFRNADIDKGFSLLFAAHSLMKSSEPEVARSNKENDSSKFFFFTSPQLIHRKQTFPGVGLYRSPYSYLAGFRTYGFRTSNRHGTVNEDNLKGNYWPGRCIVYVCAWR